MLLNLRYLSRNKWETKSKKKIDRKDDTKKIIHKRFTFIKTLSLFTLAITSLSFLVFRVSMPKEKKS